MSKNDLCMACGQPVEFHLSNDPACAMFVSSLPSHTELIDERYAARMREECSSGDLEGNGCMADKVLLDLLREIGMERTAAAYEKVECWRA